MKLNAKKIVTLVLTAAIALSGISLNTSVTAHAATAVSDVQKWGTITMKPGDTKKVIVKDKDGKDITTQYKWSSSDNSVVKVNMDFVSQSDYTECLELIAAGSGTATLTGSPVGLSYASTELTVTVKMAGPTAKQKKCKHSFKVTKKATCERAGVKTCKKCKLQKSIKMTSHKYVNTTVKTTEYDGFEYIVLCSGCDCPDTFECPKFTQGIECDTKCDYTIVITTKARAGVIAYPYHYDEVLYLEDYDSLWDSTQHAADKVMYHAMYDLKSDTHGAYEDFEYLYGEHEVTKTVKACTYCGKYKE